MITTSTSTKAKSATIDYSKNKYVMCRDEALTRAEMSFEEDSSKEHTYRVRLTKKLVEAFGDDEYQKIVSMGAIEYAGERADERGLLSAIIVDKMNLLNSAKSGLDSARKHLNSYRENFEEVIKECFDVDVQNGSWVVDRVKKTISVAHQGANTEA